MTIKFKDELTCYLHRDRSIAMSIKERFSFLAKNYKYSPAFKYGGWDGRISLYNLKTNEFYVGLLPDLFKWAKDLGYKVTFDEDEKYLFKPFIKFDDNFFEVDLPKIAKFPPKGYQEKYIKEALTWNKLLILSPTGSGKS